MKSGFILNGIDLGSNCMFMLEKLCVMMLVGEGVNCYEVGVVWYLFDMCFEMLLLLVGFLCFFMVGLDCYNVIVFVGGFYLLFGEIEVK